MGGECPREGPPQASPPSVQLSPEAEAAASGDICFLTLQPGSPRPLSPGCVVILPTWGVKWVGERELEEVEKGVVDGGLRDALPTLVSPPFFFTSFNLQGKDFRNTKR